MVSKTDVVEERDPWELETGLPNDVDAYMVNCRFGTRDEYLEAVVASGGEGQGLMFLSDLVDGDGEAIGQQGWSVGSGWSSPDDGESITHAQRKNVVNSSQYGRLQFRTVKELKVDMRKYGKPTIAASWNGLGFHWMLEQHDTLKEVEGKRVQKAGLMPTLFIGVKEEFRTGKVEVAAPKKAAVDPGLEGKLKELAQTNSLKDFKKAALKVPGVADDDDLLASVMDDSPAGFFATHQH